MMQLRYRVARQSLLILSFMLLLLLVLIVNSIWSFLSVFIGILIFFGFLIFEHINLIDETLHKGGKK